MTATSKTIIDHIISNRSEAVSKSGVLACGISDHDVVFMTKHMRLPKLRAPPKLLNVRNYKNLILMLLDKICIMYHLTKSNLFQRMPV